MARITEARRTAGGGWIRAGRFAPVPFAPVLIAGLALPAAAQSFPPGQQDPSLPRYQICVENRGRFFASFTLEALATPGAPAPQGWQRLQGGPGSLPLGQSACWTFIAPHTSAVRLRARASSNMQENMSCELTLQPARPARLYIQTGTFRMACTE
ncbi:hypothetical protein [Falsiroseomonas tokyonensis]|uniref:Uncharacterized protein n=1 Tax=Falsiroseomonas tokyonensis TaxID=430521 RepID=A0ABV7BN39_9PROT|nr:hypothetical protein [Falsiroseomonas tokyonensis]MBU8536480.1 hypothetical protein [Falsiroseomonas tokyonensis]